MQSLLLKMLNCFLSPASVYGPTIEQKEVASPYLTYPSRENKKWYVIMLWGNMPQQAKEEVERRVQEAKLESHILRVLAPQELNPDLYNWPAYAMLEITAIPGFLLVEIEMTDDARRLILGIRQVKRFVTDVELQSFSDVFGVNPFSLIPEDE